MDVGLSSVITGLVLVQMSLMQSFSSGCDFALGPDPQGTFSNIWRHF